MHTESIYIRIIFLYFAYQSRNIFPFFIIEIRLKRSKFSNMIKSYIYI